MDMIHGLILQACKFLLNTNLLFKGIKNSGEIDYFKINYRL